MAAVQNLYSVRRWQHIRKAQGNELRFSFLLFPIG